MKGIILAEGAGLGLLPLTLVAFSAELDYRWFELLGLWRELKPVFLINAARCTARPNIDVGQDPALQLCAGCLQAAERGRGLAARGGSSD